MFEMLSSLFSMFDVYWETAFYSFIYDLNVIIQFGCIDVKWGGKKKQGSAQD